MIVYFIRCTKCGAWRYVKGIVKTAKCMTCAKSICFKQAIKQKYDIKSLQYAPEILKRLKLQDAKKSDPKITFTYD